MKTLGIGKNLVYTIRKIKYCTGHFTLHSVQPMGDIAKQWLTRIQYVLTPQKRWIKTKNQTLNGRACDIQTELLKIAQELSNQERTMV